MQIIFIVSAMQLGCRAKPPENYVLYISYKTQNVNKEHISCFTMIMSFKVNF